MYENSTPGGFAIDMTGSDGEVLVSVAGEIDLHSGQQLEATLTRLTPGVRVLVDLRAVTFMDSTGVRLLLGESQRLCACGGSLLVRPSPAARRVLDLLGLEFLIEPRSAASRSDQVGSHDQ
jgi:stage II sporulation protein AA (anti-sigma F factor antagonist)